MKGSTKGSPAASVEKSFSGKKLVQARLPFKILSSPVSASVSGEIEPRKRRLSSDIELPTPKILCTSETKENLSSGGDAFVISDDEDSNEKATRKKGNSGLNPFVKLHNIDDFIKNSKDEDGRIVLSPKTPKPSEKWSTPIANKSSGKGNKFVIKLPLSNKKKRKLSEKLNASMSPDRSSIENTLEDGKTTKKPKTSVDEASGGKDPPQGDVVQISDDDDTLSANIRLQVTNMSEDSVLESSNVKKISVEGAAGLLPEEAANDSELFSAMKERGKAEIPPEELNSDTDEGNDGESSDDRKAKEEKSHKVTPEKAKPERDDRKFQLPLDVEEGAKEKSAPDADSDDSEKKLTTPVRGADRIVKQQQRSATPKQLQKQKEREDKIKQREEERLQRQKEKEEKERQRKREREEKEEQRRKEKEEKEEQKRKEKEEKEKKRLAEIEAKNEEKRKKEEIKEEERRKREEEKRRKELEKEEAENKKRKAAEVFTKFFLQSKPTGKEPNEEDQNSVDSDKFKNSTFMPFQVKGDMKLAPLFRRILDCEAKAKLDEIFVDSWKPVPSEELYLTCLKTGKISPGKDTKTWLLDDDSDCLVVGKFCLEFIL